MMKHKKNKYFLSSFFLIWSCVFTQIAWAGIENQETRFQKSSYPCEKTLAQALLHPLQIGDRIGKFNLTKVLGKGGMGIVFLAEDQSLNRQVAIKTIRPEMLIYPSLIKRFLEEAQLLAQLESAHIIRIYEASTVVIRSSEDPSSFYEQPYYVMEFLKGDTLETAMGILFKKTPPSQLLSTVLSWMTQITKGLILIHQKGIIHRDLKPANVFYQKGVLKIGDFGLSKALTRNSISQPAEFSADFFSFSEEDSTFQSQVGVFAGTPQYASPEQVMGEILSFRSDIYSLGVIFYKLCIGDTPLSTQSWLNYYGNSQSLFHEHRLPEEKHRFLFPIPKKLKTLIHRMISQDLDTRPTAQEVLDILEEIQKDI